MVNGYNLDNFELKFKEYLSAGNKNRDSLTLKGYVSDIRIFIDWLRYAQNTQISPVDSMEAIFNEHLNDETINSYKTYLLEVGTPVSTVNRKLSSIRHLLDYCRAHGIIDDGRVFAISNLYKKVERSFTGKLGTIVPTKQSKVDGKIFSSKNNTVPAILDKTYQRAATNKTVYKVIERVRDGANSQWIHVMYLGLFCLVFIFLLQFIKKVNTQGALAGQAHAMESGRTLAFQGKLTDPLGNNIYFKTNVRFRLYASEKSEVALYDSGTCEVIPNKEGLFKVVIGGGACGTKLSNTLFDKYPSLYLGIKMGKDKEIANRQRIPSTNLSQNTNLLQGFPVGTVNSSIPYISDTGIIKLANPSPSIESTSAEGSFTIQSASDLSIQSGKSADVNIITGENGSVHFRNANSGLDNILIANDGNVSIGSNTPGLFKLEVGGSLGPSLDSIYDLGSTSKTWNNLYVNKICFSTVLDCIDGGYTERWVVGMGTISPLDNKSDLLLGATATSSAQIKLSSTAGNSSFIRSGYLGIGTTAPISALHVEGTLTLTGNVTDITTSNNENLTLAAHGTGLVVINDAVKIGSDSSGVYIDENGTVSDTDGDLVLADNVYLGSTTYGIRVNTNGEIVDADGSVTVNDDLAVNGNFIAGATATSGSSVMDIGGTGTANALCHSSANGTDNESIVDCTSSPTADFAEMYPVESGASYGDVMSIGSEIIKTKDGQSIRKLTKNSQSYSNKIIGVVSDNYGDFISVGHNIDKKDNPMPIALKGRVPVRINPSSEAIKAGDYLTGSLIAGTAIKADQPGVMIGQALEDWRPGENKTTVMVFVQTSYADPTTFADRIVAFASSALHTMTGSLFVEKEISSPVVRTDRLEAKNISSEYIYSPVVETETVLTSSIRARKDNDISIALDNKPDEATRSGDLAKLIIRGLQDRPVATIDATGTITTEGGITAREASISGTLAAKEVIADNITHLKERLEQTVKKTESIDKLDTDINSIQSTLANIKNQSLTPVSTPIEQLPDTLTDPTISEGLFSNLVVSGTTSLFQLSVYNGITSLSDELKISAVSSINLLDGAAVLTKDGNLVLNGTLIAKSGIKTNDIRAVDDTSDIRAHLNSSTSKNTAFTFQDQSGNTVAQIDASGSATFRSLALENTNVASSSAIIAAADNFLQNGQYAPAIDSRKAVAGSAVIPPHEKEIIIYNEAIKDSSLIYLTPTGKSASGPISIAEKVSCATGLQTTVPCKPYFKVAPQSVPDDQISFNWLIIN